MLLERATRRQGRHQLHAVHGRSVFGLVRRHADQEWRDADSSVVMRRVSTETQDAVLHAAVERELAANVLRPRLQLPH